MRVYELHMKSGDVIRVESNPMKSSEDCAIYIDAHGHANVGRGWSHPGDWHRLDIYPAGEWMSLRISSEVTRGG